MTDRRDPLTGGGGFQRPYGKVKTVAAGGTFNGLALKAELTSTGNTPAVVSNLGGLTIKAKAEGKAGNNLRLNLVAGSSANDRVSKATDANGITTITAAHESLWTGRTLKRDLLANPAVAELLDITGEGSNSNITMANYTFTNGQEAFLGIGIQFLVDGYASLTRRGKADNDDPHEVGTSSTNAPAGTYILLTFDKVISTSGGILVFGMEDL